MEPGFVTKFTAMTDKQKTVEDVLKEKFNELLKNKELERFLHAPCSGALESAFENRINTWLSHNQLNEGDSCLFGIPFEYHMVGIMGMNKLWKFISWRGDKFIDKSKESTTFPESNAYPDLLYECTKGHKTTGFRKGDRMAIECKWTQYNGKSEDSSAACKIKNVTEYNEWKKEKYHLYYENALKDGTCSFYLAIGVGWNTETSTPEAVYLVPASAIKDIVKAYKKNPDTAVSKIQSYRLKGTPKLKKDESLLSAHLQKKEMKKITKQLEKRIEMLKKNMGLS